jgi:hypothetical protein
MTVNSLEEKGETAKEGERRRKKGKEETRRKKEVRKKGVGLPFKTTC